MKPSFLEIQYKYLLNKFRAMSVEETESTTPRLTGYTVATLPTGETGDLAYVTDAMMPSYLGPLIGGGTITCPVMYDGEKWISH